MTFEELDDLINELAEALDYHQQCAKYPPGPDEPERHREWIKSSRFVHGLTCGKEGSAHGFLQVGDLGGKDDVEFVVLECEDIRCDYRQEVKPNEGVGEVILNWKRGLPDEPKREPKPIVKMTLEEWREKGTELFGPKMEKWKFECPSCGHVQTIEDFVALGMTKQEGADRVYFSCIGRWNGNMKNDAFQGKKASPCNYTSGGLINIAPVIVTTGSDGKTTSFAFHQKDASSDP